MIYAYSKMATITKIGRKINKKYQLGYVSSVFLEGFVQDIFAIEQYLKLMYGKLDNYQALGLIHT